MKPCFPFEIADIDNAPPLCLQLFIVLIYAIILHKHFGCIVNTAALDQPSWRLWQRNHQDCDRDGECNLSRNWQTPCHRTSDVAEPEIVKVCKSDTHGNEQELHLISDPLLFEYRTLASVETSLPRRFGLHSSDWLSKRQLLFAVDHPGFEHLLHRHGRCVDTHPYHGLSVHFTKDRVISYQSRLLLDRPSVGVRRMTQSELQHLDR